MVQLRCVGRSKTLRTSGSRREVASARMKLDLVLVPFFVCIAWCRKQRHDKSGWIWEINLILILFIFFKPSRLPLWLLEKKATLLCSPKQLSTSDVMQASSAKLHFWMASLVVYSLLHLLWMPLLASTRHVCVQQLPSPAPGSLPCQVIFSFFNAVVKAEQENYTVGQRMTWWAPLKLRKLLAILPQNHSTLVPLAVYLTVVVRPFQLQ